MKLKHSICYQYSLKQKLHACFWEDVCGNQVVLIEVDRGKAQARSTAPWGNHSTARLRLELMCVKNKFRLSLQYL